MPHQGLLALSSAVLTLTSTETSTVHSLTVCNVPVFILTVLPLCTGFMVHSTVHCSLSCRIHSDAAATSSASVPLHSNTLQPAQERTTSSSSSFVWSQYWYPVHVVDQVDPSRPHAIQLLGKQLVLWRDSQGVWRCNEDACPHRYVATVAPAAAAVQ